MVRILLFRCFLRFLLVPHQLFQLHVEVSLGLIGHNLLQQASPRRPIACALVFEYADELHETVHGGQLVGEVSVHIAENVAVEIRGEADAHDEHRERPHHLRHLLGTQLAVHRAFRVALDGLTVSGVNTAVASPSRVAVDDEGEKTNRNKIDRRLDMAPKQTERSGDYSRKIKWILHVVSILCCCYPVIYSANIGRINRWKRT